MAHRTKKPAAVAALTVSVVAGQREYLLIPDGEFRSMDGSGRPEEVPFWRNDAEIAARVIARAQARTARMVVDYEHQTLKAEQLGEKAPASGWIDRASLRYEPGVGILGSIDWNPPAAKLIADGEYAYLSPVFLYSPVDGEVLLLRHVALTNEPGLDLPQVALRAAASSDFSTEEEPQMTLLQQLLASLGLAKETTEADLVTAVVALKAKADQVAGKDAEIAVLSAKKPNPAEYVPVTAMQEVQTENVSLKAKLNEIEVGTVVQAALKSGQLLPAQREWAEDLGKSNLVALKSYVDKTPVNPALAGLQTDGKELGEGAGNAVLSTAELKVASQLGLTAEQYAAGKKA